MNELERNIASFYARLASIKDTKQIRQSELLSLMEECQSVVEAILDKTLVNPHEAEHPTQEPWNPPKDSISFTTKLDGQLSMDEFYKVFADLYWQAQRIIVALLNGEQVVSPLTPLWQLDTKQRIVREGWGLPKKDSKSEEAPNTVTQITTVLLQRLLTLITEDPFPFKQCPVCTKVFVHMRKQMYCSPNCTYQGVEGKRREERKEYMKKYHLSKRAESQAEQKKATAQKQREIPKRRNN